MTKKCTIHHCPMRETSDALGPAEWLSCNCCEWQKSIDRLERLIAEGKQRGTLENCRATIARLAEKIEINSGRWFAVLEDGKPWGDMSIPQINIARAEGRDIEVLNEI